jgi:putative nucleotidyltransferase with HDIG domain
VFAAIFEEFMEPANIKEILAKIKSFPSMPATGAKMLKMLEDPDTTVDEIEDVLRHDPGLTGNVLKLANSAYFGVPAKVASTRQAVLLLGLKKLIQLVIASCVNAVMDKPVPGYNLPPGDLWRHSIAVSIAAEALVKDKKNIESDDIFTPALLHDIGKLILGHFVKDQQEAIEKIADKGVPYVVAENMVLGTDHAKVGAQILTQWSFPCEIVDAVRWHHDPDFPEQTGASKDIVYLANLLCQTNADGSQAGTASCDLSPAVIARLGLDVNQFAEIKDRVVQWVDELCDALTFN